MAYEEVKKFLLYWKFLVELRKVFVIIETFVIFAKSFNYNGNYCKHSTG